ncbi:hypothetical protein [Streptomyces venezuelae]|uniref:hypothetical protein n=1 Tax=Streptomyces venezuelae TaxID=54571 RepID=UPI001F180335|nr:hypothetical protein [Streptomyces venezuelae]
MSPRRQPSARTAGSARKSANCSGPRPVIPSSVQGTPAAVVVVAAARVRAVKAGAADHLL